MPRPKFTDSQRLEYVALLLRTCPHVEITYNDDELLTDELEREIPVGWSVILEGCERSISTGSDFRQCIDLDMLANLESLPPHLHPAEEGHAIDLLPQFHPPTSIPA